MLGLPSTTEVNKRLPKEAFYRNLKMSMALRASFTDDIDKFVVRNSIKGSTTNISVGNDITEIMVLEVVLKYRCVPKEVLSAIAVQNPHKLLFVGTCNDECFLAVQLKDLVVSKWQALEQASIVLNPANIDKAWDSLASQIAYGDMGVATETVEQRYAYDAKLLSMKEELAKLETRRKKEKQFIKKNAMFEETKKLKAQIKAFEEGR